ncbi:PH domain-containing protein [Thermomonospora amylolytica]|uniref:PH domain-containing protein n=1 Tax=Thermomonospora amylolytica TaxID=1411117 RepID=UPI000E6C8570|nr:PH domain-containing protein [Thermomonospora amylolytica]
MTDGKPLVFRSTVGRVAAWAWLTFSVLMLADTVLRGDDLAAAVAAAVLLFGCGLAYVLGLRPRITAGEDAVEIRNPLRDIRVPWPAVRKIEATHALQIRFTDPEGGERLARAWTLQTSPRARTREERRLRQQAAGLPPKVAARLTGRTALGYAVEQLNDLAKKHRRKSAENAAGTVAWSRPALAALIFPGAVLLASIALALLG